MFATPPNPDLFAIQSPERWPYVLAALAGVTLLAALWIMTLRLRLKRQTEELRARFAKEAELEARIRQGQKLEAVGRLAGGIAHDFNNLLTVINGCSELLDSTLPPDHLSRDLLNDIRRAGERAAGLTTQLLLFSRQRPMNLVAVDLNNAVVDAVRLLGRVLGENVIVETHLAPGLRTVKADYGLIHQIILNLAVNSRDAMPHGGTVTVRTRAVEIPDGRTMNRLTLADTGWGMDEATQKKIFEPFFTTKDVGKGTGLGLATVYGIVKTLGGEVHFSSKVGSGTTFEIDLPAAGLSEHSDPVHRRKTTVGVDELTPMPARGVILVVEDDEMVLTLAEKSLQRHGYQVLTARTSTDAVGKARNTKKLDLLITDVVMPQLSGPEIANIISAFRPGLRVLFMSGHTPEEILRQGVRDLDAHSFIQKPFTPESLMSSVQVSLVQTLPEIDLGAMR
ncbi:hybrid sensor histidine kinase/response regulator [Limnoglobus roseus]|uniref:histidine kinase n=1 Tax=Limnoglobus roseus TaxID=2598579 RepID=A0A5C1ADK5_9BACT|nr:ATP-binding protein [Limnoglobus roseus]QEL15852.1 PAS domain-containing sensor histidine kinase [Limnoglobus roseus]